jgi:hypothetical protein
MLTIDKSNNITLTRGDTLTLTVSLLKDNAPYVPTEGDSIRFAVSKSYKGQSDYTLKLSKTIPNDTLTFTCESDETELDYAVYNYDIEITHEDGCVDTFISGKLTITGESK